MKYVLMIFAILFFVGAGAGFVNSKSVLHEMVSLILVLIGAVFISSTAIIDAIHSTNKKNNKAIYLLGRIIKTKNNV